jgi:hypothetical protein
VAHHWGVSKATVRNWRKALGVPRYTPGTRRLYRDWFPERRDEKAIARWKASLHSPERGAKIAAAQRGRPRPPQIQAMLRKLQLGRHPSEETRQKLREAMKRRVPLPSGRAWQPDEDALLGTAPDATVAFALGRTWSSVSQRRWKLGIESWLMRSARRRR